MEYSKMVRQAVSSGEGEEAMWKSVARVDSLLEDIKEENPDIVAYDTYDELMAAIKKAL